MSNRNTSTPLRTSRRRNGQRMSAVERKATQEVFLQAFALTANVRAACMKAGIDRSTVYQWQEHDEFFSLRFKQAELDANDVIRAEMFRRAVQGVEKPMVSMGKVVYTTDEQGKPKPMMVREYSDSLLSLLAKARMPEFRDKQQVEVSGSLTIKTEWGASPLTEESEVQYGSNS